MKTCEDHYRSAVLLSIKGVHDMSKDQQNALLGTTKAPMSRSVSTSSKIYSAIQQLTIKVIDSRTRD